MHFRLAIRHVKGSTGQPFAPPLAVPLASRTSRPTATPSTTHHSSWLSAKMAVVYSIDSAIPSFFASSTTATRQQCDARASSLAGGSPVSPVPIQGPFSYTLTAGVNNGRIFQFRAQESSLDMETMKLVRATHPQFVAGCKSHGTMGGSRTLHVYEMNNLPGSPYIVARDISAAQPPDAVLRQRNTVKDLARYVGVHIRAPMPVLFRLILTDTGNRFFLQSWNASQPLARDDSTALLAEFHEKLDLLARSLPPRFAPNLAKVRQALPALFSGTALPFVLGHGDACEMTLLVNSTTGSITGIVDWAESRVLPLGFSLWALENIFGCMDAKGWRYYDNRRELEDLFWRTFSEGVGSASDGGLQLIWAARMAGLFYRYGFIFEGKDIQGVVDQADASSPAYIDAFCLADDLDTTTNW